MVWTHACSSAIRPDLLAGCLLLCFHTWDRLQPIPTPTHSSEKFTLHSPPGAQDGVWKSNTLRSSIHVRAAANNKQHVSGQSRLGLMGHLMSTGGRSQTLPARLYFFCCTRDKSRRRAAALHFQHGVHGHSERAATNTRIAQIFVFT